MQTPETMFLKIYHEHLEQVKCTKCLGIFIDNHLTLANHIEYCKYKEISRGLYAINMSKCILKTFENPILQPYASTYGIRV